MWGAVTAVAMMLAVGGLIWLYARYLGKGDVRAAFDDPPSRKKIIIIGAVIAGIAVVIFLILLGTDTISFN